MKKFILKDGKEVKFGDMVIGKADVNGCHIRIVSPFDTETEVILKNLGIVREIELSDTPIADKVINDTFEKEAKIKQEQLETAIKEHHLEIVREYVARKLGVNVYEAVKYLNDLENINPASALNIYLKRISLKLNKKYPHTPIRSLEKIYIISIYDGKVESIDPKEVKSLKHFAWFRSKEDADFARNCVIELIERMFGKDDQSKD